MLEKENVRLGGEQPQTGEENSKRCSWCHSFEAPEKSLEEFEVARKGEDLKKYYACSPVHKNLILRYIHYVEKTYWLFLFFVLLIPLVLIILAIFYHSFIFVFALFLSVGLGVMIIPLLGNQLIVNLGIKKANQVGRILGAMLFIIGLTLVLINGLKILRG
ncbi:MAG: hypothetical protein ACTSXO_10010 [Candidatus Heimdallarchaeota archaeon]|nr:MAG: hypothetical protein DRP02_06900 [Candidatus Gerdarchaeota archaeon]